MTKIIINSCFGGFGLSDKAIERLLQLGYPKEEIKADKCSNDSISNKKYRGLKDIQRNHPLLIQVIEELGREASSRFASLKIIEIPDNVKWEIEEYDGVEWISEKHRRWYQ